MSKKLKRILYAEDEPSIREIGLFALRDLGQFQVDVCETGDQIYDQACAAKPDLILLDVLMPGLSGPEAHAQLKSHAKTQDIPVIYVTAKTKPEEIDALMATGVQDVIIKPFDPFTLATRIQEIWDRQYDR